MDKAIFAATYSDLKFIKTRKTAQIILEIPLEAASAFLEAFGAPNPAAERHVAIAALHSREEHERLHTPAEQETPPAALPEAYKVYDVKGREATKPQGRPFEKLPYPQQAALRCQDLNFREYLREIQKYTVKDAEDAAVAVRAICQVQSRADIRPGTGAEKLWLRLNTHYTLWQSDREAA
jgi:hypothetical protein